MFDCPIILNINFWLNVTLAALGFINMKKKICENTDDGNF